MKPVPPMTPQRQMMADLFFAKQKFVEIKYRLEKDLADKLDTFYESAFFFIKLGNLSRGKEEIMLANIRLLPHLKA